MNYKKIERLKELVFEYHWYHDFGLMVFIYYCDCTEVFRDIFNVDCEDYPECVAGTDFLCVPHFEEFLEDYLDEDDEVEDIFPKEEEEK